MHAATHTRADAAGQLQHGHTDAAVVRVAMPSFFGLSDTSNLVRSLVESCSAVLLLLPLQRSTSLKSPITLSISMQTRRRDRCRYKVSGQHRAGDRAGDRAEQRAGSLVMLVQQALWRGVFDRHKHADWSCCCAPVPSLRAHLPDMINMGSKPAYLLTAAQWLWAEIPVRLAKRLRDLDDLPFGLSKSAEIQNLSQMYRASLQDALAFPCPTNSAEELAFTERVVKRLLVRHQETVVDLASGINGGFLGRIPLANAAVNTRPDGSVIQSLSGAMSGRPLKAHFLLQEFLDKFNSARIGLRLLLAQHAALHSNTNSPSASSTQAGTFVGVIELNCNPARIVSQAVEDASVVCRSLHGVAPTVVIHDQSAAAGGMKDFHYVTAHLRCMVFELLKNAMKATVQHAKRKLAAGETLQVKDLPPIQVVLVDGATDVTIKVSDRGGGFKRAELPLVFTYTYSATQKTLKQTQALIEQARKQHEKVEAAVRDAGTAPDSTADASAAGSSPSSPIAALSTPTPDAACLPKATRGWLTGENFHPTLNIAVNDFGEAFGLPITRLYARYCGGDLQLFSLANYGTDAYLYLGKPGNDFHEVIQD